MGLFSRRGTTSEPAPVEWASVEAEQQKRSHGPFDRSQVEEMGPRVDLGAIWLPVMPGLELRMEIDKKTQKVTGVTAALEGSNLQVQAFAAPRTEGIWDEIRHEIADSVSKQGGVVDDVPGVFGRELLVRMPVKGPDGQPAQRPARFIGVDGPRWFVRGVLAGRAALDPEAAKALESVFANIVVVRDQSPRPPRDLLPLTLPKSARKDGEPAPAAAGSESAAPQMADFNPLRRGPEITQIG
ncbi:DUF3710 domain-containing protein [Promicromonospora citrea]|uniref:DUF3710 domain-containing protein n=1 Tax=Promicromonospora citrea TaxID=43677 RepID=A0A8H9L415_9MICO|nr:DUF3710 domain-containing protein [Promicromonospora citrea]NNH54903.1 DUF3710 domain-containing protein [Promicromonospora citrea]GGM23348.1 hypothetical protein GCM10010102_18880 [Promicromonospora citrea]